MDSIIIPIFVCFLLPVAIIYIVFSTRRNEINKKTEIVLKAIENGQQVDPDLFREPSKTKSMTVKQSLLGKLTAACVTAALGIALLAFGLTIGNKDLWTIVSLVGIVLLAVGVALFIVFFVGKKMLAKEIEAEESVAEASNPVKGQ